VKRRELGQLTRRELLRLGGVGAASLLASSLLQACGASPSANPATSTGAVPTGVPSVQSKLAGQGGILVAAGDGIGDNFYPAAAFQGWAHSWVFDNVFETLYTTRDMKALIPALALSYQVSADGLTYTFQLRQGVKFHDGTAFNAAAVEFNYMRMLDNTHPFYEPNAIFRTSVLPGVAQIKATGEYEVQVIRQYPDSAMLAALALPYAGIVSPTSIQSDPKGYGAKPIGTGPFVFEKATKGSEASILANSNYWNGRPKLDRVVIRVIADDQTMTASLLSGEVDITPFVDFKNLQTFSANPNLKVQVVPAASTGYIGIQTQKPNLKDVRVRQAIAHAINKQDLISTIFYGEAYLAGGIVPPALWAYDPDYKDYYNFDVQKAKDLLSQAGFGAGLDLQLWCQISGFWPRMAELVQSQLKAIGINTTIQQVATAKFYAAASEGKHDLFLGDVTWGSMDPEEAFYAFYGCQNPRSISRWGFCDADFDSALAKQSTIPDQEGRKKALWNLQKRLLDYVPQVFNYYQRFATVMNKRVAGYQPMAIRTMYLEGVSVTM